MKRYSIIVLFLLVCSLAIAQKIDSVKHAKGNLFFHIYGSGEPVVLLTGGPGASYMQLEDVAIHLAKKYLVILPEQRGTGRSYPTPYDTSTINLRTAISDINLILDHLHIKQAAFVGHSWGGMLAMSFGTKYATRVKKLILLDPGPFKLGGDVFERYSANQQSRLSISDQRDKDAALKKMLASGATKEDSAAYFRWELVPVIYDRTIVDSLINIINKGGLNPRMGSLMFQSLSKEGFDLTKSLASFPRPIDIISGSQDPLAFVSYDLKILLPKAQLHWINKASHFPMYEQPEEFYTTLLKVLGKK